MCGESIRAYPYRHNHPNHFPPPNRKTINRPIPYSDNVPIMLQPRSPPSAITTSYPLSPPPTHLSCPPTPSSAAPAHLTHLLQEVLLVMDTIMCERSIVQEEDELLGDLTELVVTLQEEAEGLVEEFVEEVESAPEVGELEMWVNDLELVGLRSPRLEVIPPEGRRHERFESQDSGIGMDESEVGFGVLDKVVSQSTKTRHEIMKKEGEDMIDFAAWRRMAENERPRPKTNNFPPNGQISPRKLRGQANDRKKETRWPKLPKRVNEAIPSIGKGKQKTMPRPPRPQFRDSGLDISSPVRSSPKNKPCTGWI